MFDKWKIRQELCKVYKMYDKQAHSVLYSKACDNIAYNQLQDIKYAITYMLCEYFDLNYEFYYNNLPFSYKWNIAYDYVKYHDRCKEAYEQFINENNSNYGKVFYTNLSNLKSWDIGQKALNTLSQKKGTIIYDESTHRMYISDGKNFVEMC